ncbi:MAG TPA: hypothetical protein VGF79_15170 [Bacteroidia bacterium]
MNKAIAIIVFVFLSLISYDLSAKDSTYQMVIYRGENIISTLKNYDKFDFDDTSGNQISGRIKMINDSQFYFVNYFYERRSRDYHLNEIKNLVGINQMNKSGKKRMYISAPTAILVALFVPFGAYYLLFREIYLTIKEGPGHSKKHNQVTSNEEIKIVINKIPAGS